MLLIVKNQGTDIANLITSQVNLSQDTFSLLIAKPIAPYTQYQLTVEFGKYSYMSSTTLNIYELKKLITTLGYTLYAKAENESFQTTQIV